MKNSIIITAIALLLLSCSTKLNAQQGVSINSSGNNPDNSAMLDVSSTSKGQLLPRLTTTERNNIVSPAHSLLIFNITTDCYEGYNANLSQWVSFGCIGCQLPGAFSASAATNITQTSFSANWTASSGATTYYLDVATDAAFTGLVAGYNNLNVGGATTYNVTGLTCNTNYYYRIRAANSCGTSANSNTISTATSSCFTCGTTNVTFTYRGSNVTYGTVNGQNSTCWLDRYLGASRVAASETDNLAYGDLFQWGRLDDGHQSRTSGTTGTLSTGDVPGHSNFIYNSYDFPYDWRSGQNNNLWQGVSGINNPCPGGWRIPTEAEFDAERLSWSSSDLTGAYNSVHKYCAAGYRNSGGGSAENEGSYGYAWTSTIDVTRARFLYFSSGSGGFSTANRTRGYGIRCIKN